jgi:rhamnosyltransferase
MQISLIIPTYNAEQYLPVLLTTLKQQSISFELILVDSSSLDNTENIAKQYTDKITVILVVLRLCRNINIARYLRLFTM